MVKNLINTYIGRRFALLSLLVLAAIALAACSGSDESTDEQGPAAPEGPQGPSVTSVDFPSNDPMCPSLCGPTHLNKVEFAAICLMPIVSLAFEPGPLVHDDRPLVEGRDHQTERGGSVVLAGKLKTRFYEPEPQSSPRQIRSEAQANLNGRTV